MRSVLIGDLLAAAEVLAAVPEPARADRLARLLDHRLSVDTRRGC